MKEKYLTEQEAIELLKQAIEKAGGVGLLAKEVGISTSAISNQLHARRPIQGKLAKFLGIRVQRRSLLVYRTGN